MNLILLERDDFILDDEVELRGRRFEHISRVHRAAAGAVLTVGLRDGKTGRGEVTAIGEGSVRLRIVLDSPPPPPVPLTLVLALPRPKVLNRVIAAASSLGIKRIVLVNAWRVEKSYWSTPRLTPENLALQATLGLEQARDTMTPAIETHRLFRPFVEQELPAIARETRLLVAHPGSPVECPRNLTEAVTLVVGPEGGFIEAELGSLARAGAEFIHMGPRILRVETAVAALVGRMF
jgi:16S rRNA (uracil1498-N3)-methyltransferase